MRMAGLCQFYWRTCLVCLRYTRVSIGLYELLNTGQPAYLPRSFWSKNTKQFGMDCTSSSADYSLVGNTPYAESCCMLCIQSLADRRSELCRTLFRQIVNNEFHMCCLQSVTVWYSSVLRHTRHIIGHFGDNFTGQMTQPTVSYSTEGWWLVNQVKGQSHQAQFTKR